MDIQRQLQERFRSKILKSQERAADRNAERLIAEEEKEKKIKAEISKKRQETKNDKKYQKNMNAKATERLRENTPDYANPPPPELEPKERSDELVPNPKVDTNPHPDPVGLAPKSSDNTAGSNNTNAQGGPWSTVAKNGKHSTKLLPKSHLDQSSGNAEDGDHDNNDPGQWESARKDGKHHARSKSVDLPMSSTKTQSNKTGPAQITTSSQSAEHTLGNNTELIVKELREMKNEMNDIKSVLMENKNDTKSVLMEMKGIKSILMENKNDTKSVLTEMKGIKSILTDIRNDLAGSAFEIGLQQAVTEATLHRFAIQLYTAPRDNKARLENNLLLKELNKTSYDKLCEALPEEERRKLTASTRTIQTDMFGYFHMASLPELLQFNQVGVNIKPNGIYIGETTLIRLVTPLPEKWAKSFEEKIAYLREACEKEMESRHPMWINLIKKGLQMERMITYWRTHFRSKTDELLPLDHIRVILTVGDYCDPKVLLRFREALPNLAALIDKHHFAVYDYGNIIQPVRIL